MGLGKGLGSGVGLGAGVVTDLQSVKSEERWGGWLGLETLSVRGGQLAPRVKASAAKPDKVCLIHGTNKS